ncbi:MAG: hypothetical protein E7282_01095 [Lachnospiraceae bacterium]|nr:hypothetical protein [Lachnospiraceae bacterium]
MRKILLIIACILCLAFFVVIAILAIKNVNTPKGVDDTLFSFASDSTTITYEDETTTLEGDTRKEFLDLMKQIASDDEFKVEEEPDYDMEINYQNGYTALVSTEQKVIRVDDETQKALYFWELTEEQVQMLKEYVSK